MTGKSQSITWRDVRDWLSAGLVAKGYGTVQPNVSPSQQTLPVFDPGPFSERVAKLSPGALVTLGVGGGGGTVLEATYDQKFITVRAVGLPNAYDATEALAYDLDGLLLSVTSPTLIGQARVLWVARVGGAPELIDFDTADRYHFQATYITPAMTGL
jgi:hypothetical protein